MCKFLKLNRAIIYTYYHLQICVEVLIKFFTFKVRKKFAFKLPKVPDLAKYVKKRQKLFYCFSNMKSVGLKFCIEFAYSFHQTLGKSDSKRPIKNRDQIFIDLHFQLLNNFRFSDYVTNTPISVQLWAGPFISFVIFPGRESPHTLQLSYPRTPLYR